MESHRALSESIGSFLKSSSDAGAVERDGGGCEVVDVPGKSVPWTPSANTSAPIPKFLTEPRVQFAPEEPPEVLWPRWVWLLIFIGGVIVTLIPPVTLILIFGVDWS